MNLTRQEARALGLVHLWPTKAHEQGDGMNKLEQAFWILLEREFGVHARREPLKLRLAGRTWYTPDFVVLPAFSDKVMLCTCYEVKGFMRDDAVVKIKVAAATYRQFVFVLVTRPRHEGWQCRSVTSQGIDTRTWCPDWLR